MIGVRVLSELSHRLSADLGALATGLAPDLGGAGTGRTEQSASSFLCSEARFGTPGSRVAARGRTVERGANA